MGCVEIITAYILSQLQNGARAGLSFLQNLASERVLNLINLGKNANSLAQEMTKLSDVRDDLVRKVELEEIRQRKKRTLEVAGWIESVDELEDEVSNFQASFEGRRTFLEGCSFEVVYSNSELGQKAALQLGQVRDLRSQRGSLGGELVMEGTPDAVVAVPRSSARIVGGATILSEIRGYLKEDGVGIIGIYGMGGVGKTTCLAEINNELLKAGTNNDFQVTIWVTVTKDNVNISKIQEDISVRLGFSRSGEGALPENEIDRRDALNQALSRRRFLLLLDDVWEKLDLEEIGIPRPDGKQSKSKVVFTTRLEEVCVEMEAHKMVKVNLLDAADSWELFSSKVGEKVESEMNTSLKPLAEVVVGRCGGLPLALITVGQAMARAESRIEWEDAGATLKESPGEFKNMEGKVLSVLKFSFDKLEDDHLRECLLYCSLYPEDYVIDTEELIEQWVGEGFLDSKLPRALDTARIKGREVIRSLKAACLLESGGTENRADSVKMHDLVRKMAVWLTNGEHENGMGIFVVVPGGGGSFLVQSIDRWKRAKRISVVADTHDEVKLPSQVPTCPNLETLFIWNMNIELAFQDGSVFRFMPALRVLDLYGSGIGELPKDIGLLTGLQYLNLQGTAVRSLPIELGKLVNLRQLNLGHIFTLERIPSKAIETLAQLRMLNIVGGNYRVRGETLTETGVDDGKEVTLKGMECSLERLEELGIDIGSSASLERLVSSNRLSKCARFLRLMEVSDLSASSLSKVFKNCDGLRELTLDSCAELEGLRFGDGCQLQYLESLRLFHLGQAMILAPPPPCSLLRLRQLGISFSHGVKDLTWIRYLPCLETVDLFCCVALKELIRTEKGEKGEACSSSTVHSSFPSLKQLQLQGLPKLRIISEHPLHLPSLVSLRVTGCPQLKKLPLGTHSAKKLRDISGSQKWWDGLDWGQDSSIKDIFLDRFIAQ